MDVRHGRDLVLLSLASAERGCQSHVGPARNPDLFEEDARRAPQQTINVRARPQPIYGDLFERIRIKNYNSFDVSLEVRLTLRRTSPTSSTCAGMTASPSRAGRHPPTVGAAPTIEFVH